LRNDWAVLDWRWFDMVAGGLFGTFEAKNQTLFNKDQDGN